MQALHLEYFRLLLSWGRVWILSQRSHEGSQDLEAVPEEGADNHGKTRKEDSQQATSARVHSIR